MCSYSNVYTEMFKTTRNNLSFLSEGQVVGPVRVEKGYALYYVKKVCGSAKVESGYINKLI